MRRFDNVATFAKVGDEANKLITMMEDYTRVHLNDTLGLKLSVEQPEVSKMAKAQKINEVYLAEIARRTGKDASMYNGDIQMYSNEVATMQAFVNKIMLDAILPIYIDATGLAMLAEFHYLGYGDVAKIEARDNTVYNVSKMGRRQKHTKTQERKSNDKVIPMDFFGLSTISNFPKFMLGEAFVAEDMMLMATSVAKKIYKLVVKKFIAEADLVTDTKLVLSGYVEKSWMQKLKYGSAKMGEQMTIVGDAIALKDLLPATTALQILLKDEYNTEIGYMTKWNTYTVVGFNATNDEDDASGVCGLPEKKLYGMALNGRKPIHVAIGTTRVTTDEYMDNNNLSSIATYAKEIGVEIATNQKVARCDLA